MTAIRTLKRRLGDVPTRSGSLLTRRPEYVLLILIVLVAVIATGALALYLHAHRAAQSAQARTAAMDAARSHATELLSYDHSTLQDDLAQAKADATGKFRDEYLTTTKKLVSSQAKRYEVVVRARVVGTSVVKAEPERVVTLLFIDQATQSNRIKGTEIDQNRVRMTLTKVDEEWLVSGLAAL